MRTIDIPCPKAPAGCTEDTEVATGNPVVRTDVEIIHGTAVHMEWPSGHWLNYDEFGNFYSRSTGVSDQVVNEMKKLLPEMTEVRQKRREFRARYLEEAERAKGDERIPHPTKRHSSFVQNCPRGSSLRTTLIAELENKGYSTAYHWEPYCRQNGCDTYDWLLWPSNRDVALAKELQEIVE